MANSFYQFNHINTADKMIQEDWIYVLKLLNKVIKELLNLLVIKVPSKM